MSNEDKDEKIEFVSFKDFQKLNLRIGKVIKAEEIEGSRTLLRLDVDFGDEQLQAVSGLKQWYKPEDLLGNEYMFITNLERKKFMGFESQCMIFCAENVDENGEEIPICLIPAKEVKPGSRIH